MPDETGVSVVLQRGAVVSPQGVMIIKTRGQAVVWTELKRLWDEPDTSGGASTGGSDQPGHGPICLIDIHKQRMQGRDPGYRLSSSLSDIECLLPGEQMVEGVMTDAAFLAT
jgi:hypothetical protein